MSEQITYKRKLKSNEIWVRVEETTFRRVMAVSHKYNTTMSDVVRLCIELGFDKVEELYKQMKPSVK